MKDDEVTALRILATPTIFIGMVIFFIPLGLFNAWALQKMYIWFLLPLGLPALNIWHIWGIYSLIVSFKGTSKNEEKWYTRFGIGVASILFMLLLGYILKAHI